MINDGARGVFGYHKEWAQSEKNLSTVHSKDEESDEEVSECDTISVFDTLSVQYTDSQVDVEHQSNNMRKSGSSLYRETSVDDLIEHFESLIPISPKVLTPSVASFDQQGAHATKKLHQFQILKKPAEVASAISKNNHETQNDESVNRTRRNSVSGHFKKALSLVSMPKKGRNPLEKLVYGYAKTAFKRSLGVLDAKLSVTETKQIDSVIAKNFDTDQAKAKAEIICILAKNSKEYAARRGTIEEVKNDIKSWLSKYKDQKNYQKLDREIPSLRTSNDKNALDKLCTIILPKIDDKDAKPLDCIAAALEEVISSFESLEPDAFNALLLALMKKAVEIEAKSSFFRSDTIAPINSLYKCLLKEKYEKEDSAAFVRQLLPVVTYFYSKEGSIKPTTDEQIKARKDELVISVLSKLCDIIKDMSFKSREKNFLQFHEAFIESIQSFQEEDNGERLNYLFREKLSTSTPEGFLVMNFFFLRNICPEIISFAESLVGSTDELEQKLQKDFREISKHLQWLVNDITERTNPLQRQLLNRLCGLILSKSIEKDYFAKLQDDSSFESYLNRDFVVLHRAVKVAQTL